MRQKKFVKKCFYKKTEIMGWIISYTSYQDIFRLICLTPHHKQVYLVRRMNMNDHQLETRVTLKDLQKRLDRQSTQLQQAIAERKRMQEALKKSEARLKEVERIAQLGHWELDLVTNTLTWSDEIYRIFGLLPREFEATYEAFLQAVHPEDRDFVNHAYLESVQQKTPYNIAHRILLQNGEVKYVNERGDTEYDEHGNPLRSIGTVLNITERKRVEEELRKYREHLEELVEVRTAELQKEIVEHKRAEEEIQSQARFPAENPNPVLRISQNGTVLYANKPSMCLLAAWGSQINQCLPDDWREFMADVLRSRSRKLAEVECDNQVWSLMFAPIVDAGYVNIYGLDITERKQAEKKLQHAKDALEAVNQELEERVQEELKKRQEQQRLLIQRSKLESLGKLAAGIAHEINQPLAGISMGLDNILLKLSSKKITEEYLHQKIDVLLQHIDRIKHIIDHIRTFSRDQTSLSIERVDVNEVCRNAVSLVQTQYQNHNVTLLLKLDNTIGFIVGNAYKLEQVVLNLIANAKDAVDEKETMSGAFSYHKQISITTSYDPDRVYIEVKDNGIGISEVHKQNIFDPFFTTKDPEHGTGLGLSVSYGIIKEMQGDISVQSQLGEYTIMYISLPRVKGNSRK
jgi:PAS domain S-box-containing protein